MISEVSLSEDNTRRKIRTLWISGKSIVDIQKELVINSGTWDNNYYINTNGFRDFIDSVKRQYFLLLAERVSKEALSINVEGNAKLLAIKVNESQFLRERLGKEQGYSKNPDSVNININKNEPLDEKQKDNLNKILGTNIIDTQIMANNNAETQSIETHDIVSNDIDTQI